jgi:L-ribulose-5-phosphate 4-epimerase
MKKNENSLEEKLKKEVLKANLGLLKENLVIQTWGNASAIDNKREFIYIKPSGINFNELSPNKIVKVSIEGEYDSKYNPSVDTLIHLEIYKGFKDIFGIIHTHSDYATIFAQAGLSIPCLGTTHADYFNGDIPLVPILSKEKIKKDYEKNLGKSIVEYFNKRDISPLEIPGVLLSRHGVFSFGKDVKNALNNAIILEKISKLAYKTITLSNFSENRIFRLEKSMLEKHFKRKYGGDKYYGQKNGV